MKIGFTGTRIGMTEVQSGLISQILNSHFNSGLALAAADVHRDIRQEFIFGDCIGADEQAARMAKSIGYQLIARPSTLEKQRAYVLVDYAYPPEHPLERNRKIVYDCELLLACPATYEEILRSGTWSTIRCAKRVHRQLIIIFPDGKLEFG